VTDIQSDPRNSATYRAARLAVIILTTLLALAFIALVAGFLRQYRIWHAARQAAAPAASGAAASITLAPGARIVSAAVASNRLVLHVATPTGGEVEIVDLATGRLVGQVKTQK